MSDFLPLSSFFPTPTAGTSLLREASSQLLGRREQGFRPLRWLSLLAGSPPLQAGDSDRGGEQDDQTSQCSPGQRGHTPPPPRLRGPPGTVLRRLSWPAPLPPPLRGIIHTDTPALSRPCSHPGKPALPRGLWRRQDPARPPGPAHCGGSQTALPTLGHVPHAGALSALKSGSWPASSLAGRSALSRASSLGVGKGSSPEGPENVQTAHGSAGRRE